MSGEAADNHHDAGDDGHDHDAAARPDSSGAPATPAANASGDGHTHAPGTPPHQD